MVKTGPFTEILQDGVSKGLIPNKSQKARTWYRDTAKKFSTISPEKLMQGKVTLTNLMHPGRMYMFFYDPKTKEKLPFYDKFPLIFPIERYHDGFLGLNLHYLHPMYRAKLMDALYTFVDNTKFDESTKLNVSYGILKQASRARFFKPCVKRYLNGHFRTRFLYVSPEEWDIALMLPLAKWEKADEETVWEDSRKKINAL